MTPPPKKIRIVEDDEVVSQSLCALLESWNFVTEAFPDGESFLAADQTDRTCCILLDICLPGSDGQTVLRDLRKSGIRTPVIILTGHGDVAMAMQAMRDGAQDFIEKPCDDEDLVARISSAMAAHAELNACAEALAQLTPREYEVMLEVVAGRANKIVAHRLGLSPKTVEVHRARVMAKTGAESLSHLVRIALKAGIDPEA